MIEYRGIRIFTFMIQWYMYILKQCRELFINNLITYVIDWQRTAQTSTDESNQSEQALDDRLKNTLNDNVFTDEERVAFEDAFSNEKDDIISIMRGSRSELMNGIGEIVLNDVRSIENFAIVMNKLWKPAFTASQLNTAKKYIDKGFSIIIKWQKDENGKLRFKKGPINIKKPFNIEQEEMYNIDDSEEETTKEVDTPSVKDADYIRNQDFIIENEILVEQEVVNIDWKEIVLNIFSKEGKNSQTFLVLHDDENASFDAAIQSIANGWKLVALENSEERNITWTTDDPNRIFWTSDKKYNALKDTIISHLGDTIISLHNNSDQGPLTITEIEKNTEKFPNMTVFSWDDDVDNMIWISWNEKYSPDLEVNIEIQSYIDKEMNVVYEYVPENGNDTSLSNLAAKNWKKYYNIEIQHWKTERQKEYLQAVLKQQDKEIEEKVIGQGKEVEPKKYLQAVLGKQWKEVIEIKNDVVGNRQEEERIIGIGEIIEDLNNELNLVDFPKISDEYNLTYYYVLSTKIDKLWESSDKKDLQKRILDLSKKLARKFINQSIYPEWINKYSTMISSSSSLFEVIEANKEYLSVNNSSQKTEGAVVNQEKIVKIIDKENNDIVDEWKIEIIDSSWVLKDIPSHSTRRLKEMREDLWNASDEWTLNAQEEEVSQRVLDELENRKTIIESLSNLNSRLQELKGDFSIMSIELGKWEDAYALLGSIYLHGLSLDELNSFELTNLVEKVEWEIRHAVTDLNDIKKKIHDSENENKEVIADIDEENTEENYIYEEANDNQAVENDRQEIPVDPIQLQKMLKVKGYYKWPIDGIIWKWSRAALEKYKIDNRVGKKKKKRVQESLSNLWQKQEVGAIIETMKNEAAEKLAEKLWITFNSSTGKFSGNDYDETHLWKIWDTEDDLRDSMLEKGIDDYRKQNKEIKKKGNKEKKETFKTEYTVKKWDTLYKIVMSKFPEIKTHLKRMDKVHEIVTKNTRIIHEDKIKTGWKIEL